MQTRAFGSIGALALGALLLAGCGAPRMPVEELTYRAPATPPGPPIRTDIPQADAQILEAAAETLNEAGYQVSQLRPERGLLVALYRGDPEPYVDCGSFRAAAEAGEPWRPAAAQQLTVERFPGQPNWQALRQMRLDARIVNQVREGERGPELTTQATYVMTRTVDTVDDDGRILGNARHTIDFESGGVGRFAKGTTCHPMGTLEREVAGLITGTATAEAPTPLGQPTETATTITTTEIPPATTDFPPEATACPGYEFALPPGACDALALSERLGPGALPGFDVTLEGGDRELRSGEPVVLEVTMPGADRYFYVGYIQEDGVIHHLGPRYIDGDDVGERFVYRTGYEIVPPYGAEMILAITSPTPIPDEPRPSAELATSWLESLDAQLMTGANGVAARHIIVQTVP